MKAFILKILANIEKRQLLEKGDRVLVAISGGADSVSLFYVLLEILKISKKRNQAFSLELATVDYGARISAKRDRLFVKRLAKKEEVPCHTLEVKEELYTYYSPTGKVLETKRLKIPRRIQGVRNFEERARKIRYWFFDWLKQKHNFSKVALGHNLGDRAETILFNFLRGSGLKGLSGMTYGKNGYIRPLLDMQRSEILAFLKARRQPFMEDETNWNLNYTRNKIRYWLIPLLEQEFNPNLLRTLGRNSNLWAEIETFLEFESQAHLRNSLKMVQRRENITFDLQKFIELPMTMQLQTLRSMIRLTRGSLNNLSKDVILKSLNFILDPQKTKKFKEIGKLTIEKKGDKVQMITQRN